MVSISVCIPIYNNVENLKALLQSIFANSHFKASDCELILYNDGSTKLGIDIQARSICDDCGVRYISSEINRGVASSWNALCGAASGDIIVMLNDDVCAGSENWLSQIRFYFTLNRQVGIVYWCQQLVDPNTGAMKRLTADSSQVLGRVDRTPILRHNFNGAFFAFRKSLWGSIRQPDGCIGFWEDLISYCEELDLSSEAHARGYCILQLPFVWKHYHSQTFTANPDKRQRKVLSTYLTATEYRELMPVLYKPRTLKSIIRFIAESLGALEKSTIDVSLIDYSFAMLLKKWRDRTILGVKGPEYLRQMLIDGFPNALRLAIERGVVDVPSHFTILTAEGAEKVVTSDALIERSEVSIV